MSKIKAINSIIASEDIEDFTDGFSDYIPGSSDNAIFELSFKDNVVIEEEPVNDLQTPPLNSGEFNLINNKLNETPLDPSSIITKIRGLTPPIDGEPFDIKRGYQFRASTIKKLNQLKGASDNINIYLNEIIDAAICAYYDSVFKK